MLVIPFPAFDPVLVIIGPFAIRWYALAYIVGILLGWLYARALIRNGKLWGGPAPLTRRRLRRLRPLGDARHHPRRPHRLRAVLQSAAFRRASARNPRNCGTAACRSTAASSAACVAVVLFARRRGIPILSLGDVTCAVGPIGLFLGRIANFINGELWGRPTDVPWAMVFPDGGPLPRHPSQLYEAALEGLVLFVVLGAADARWAR